MILTWRGFILADWPDYHIGLMLWLLKIQTLSDMGLLWNSYKTVSIVIESKSHVILSCIHLILSYTFFSWFCNTVSSYLWHPRIFAEIRSSLTWSSFSDESLSKYATENKLKAQKVRDKQGRERFHGAFTGGYSAGYYNTVGTAEGKIMPIAKTLHTSM